MRYDVVVVGAGPAGAVTAYTAARRGASVLLVDKARFPREKPCGCCISGKAAASLEAAGLGGALGGGLAGGVRLRAFRLTAAGRTAEVGLYGGVAISRAELDGRLVERACDAGVTFLDETRAAAGGMVGGERVVELAGTGSAAAGSKVRARVMVVADGVGGRAVEAEPGMAARVSRGARVGLAAMLDEGGRAAADDEGVIGMICGRSGYVGMVRLGDGRVNVAAAVDASALQRAIGPGDAVARMINEARAGEATDGLADALHAADWRGTAKLARRRRVAGPRLLVVGDAAAYVEPFTGEGMAWAITAGIEAGEMIGDALSKVGTNAGLDRLVAAWPGRWARRVRGSQRRCRLLAMALRWPGGVAAAVAVMQRAPWMADILTRRIGVRSTGVAA